MDTTSSYSVMLAKMRAFRATKDVISKSLHDFDITIMQWLLLGYVEKNSDGTTAGAIAEELNITLPLVTRLTTSLSSKDLICIVPLIKDKRTKIITITEDGRKLLQLSDPIVKQALKDWLAPIPREEVRTYISVMLQVAYKL